MLYAIGDLHLPLGSYKPMDIFGGNWENYVEKIKEEFSHLLTTDVTVLCGDISWAMSLEGASEDFLYIDKLPGNKIILKGNHDYWWQTASKGKKHLESISVSSIDFLHNNCFFYDDIAICGTRGWFYELNRHGEHDKKIMNRELGRLRTSLEKAGDCEKYVFMHYPPIYRDYVCEEILEIFDEFRVKRCYYGHIHGAGLKDIFQGYRACTEYFAVSADYLQFKPKLVLNK